MSRPRKSSPQPRKLRGQAVLDFYRGCRRVQMVLGPWNSKHADEEYRRFLLKHAAGTFTTPDSEATINVVCDAFLKHADIYYRLPDGTPTSEVDTFERIVAILVSMYGSEPADEFGPLKLEAVRNGMIAKGWCRSRINENVRRIRHIFKWAVSKEIVPATVLTALQSVMALKRGRTKAAEREPVKPVDERIVQATLPFLSRHVRGMVRLQMLTGMRPGEVCSIRRSEIDTVKEVWLYRPVHHKMAYRGTQRVIPIGPQAQLILAEFPTEKPEDYIFSPTRSLEEIQAERSVKRATPRFRSHMIRNATKRKSKPKRQAGEHYTTLSYGRAIAKAVQQANECKATEFPLTHWHPNQLRHTAATKLRTQFGLEAAQVILGHKHADVTQIYAERNQALAVKIAAEIG